MKKESRSIILKSKESNKNFFISFFKEWFDFFLFLSYVVLCYVTGNDLGTGDLLMKFVEKRDLKVRSVTSASQIYYDPQRQLKNV